MMKKKFDIWFNAFILGGLTLALLLITAIKFGRPETDKVLLLVSVFGSIMGVMSVVCSANGRVLTFIFGLMDVSIYGVMCLINWYHGSSGLGNGLLHLLYFVPMQFVGFAQWKKRGTSENGGVKARRLRPIQWLWCVLAFMALSAVTYLILAHFDKSAATGFLKVAVLLDVLPLVCNILGQFLMSTAYMEQWVFWIGVNISSIFMWAHSYNVGGDSYSLIYMIKYCFYFLNAVNGLRVWIGLSRPAALECKK